MSSNPKKQHNGHPAKKDPVISKISKIQTELVQTTQAVHRRLTQEQIHIWNASVFGIMDTYAQLTGMPRPDSVTNLNFDEFMADKAARMERFEKWEAEQSKTPVEVLSIEEDPSGISITGHIPDGPVVNAIKNMSVKGLSIGPKVVPEVQQCQRCQHMSFNHVLNGSDLKECSFTSCVCNQFI